MVNNIWNIISPSLYNSPPGPLWLVLPLWHLGAFSRSLSSFHFHIKHLRSNDLDLTGKIDTLRWSPYRFLNIASIRCLIIQFHRGAEQFLAAGRIGCWKWGTFGHFHIILLVKWVREVKRGEVKGRGSLSVNQACLASRCIMSIAKWVEDRLRRVKGMIILPLSFSYSYDL